MLHAACLSVVRRRAAVVSSKDKNEKVSVRWTVVGGGYVVLSFIWKTSYKNT